MSRCGVLGRGSHRRDFRRCVQGLGGRVVRLDTADNVGLSPVLCLRLCFACTLDGYFSVLENPLCPRPSCTWRRASHTRRITAQRCVRVTSSLDSCIERLRSLNTFLCVHLGDETQKPNFELYVRRVFITDDCVGPPCGNCEHVVDVSVPQVVEQPFVVPKISSHTEPCSVPWNSFLGVFGTDVRSTDVGHHWFDVAPHFADTEQYFLRPPPTLIHW